MCSAVCARIPPKWQPGQYERPPGAGDTGARQSLAPAAGLAALAHADDGRSQLDISEWIVEDKRAKFEKVLAWR